MKLEKYRIFYKFKEIFLILSKDLNLKWITKTNISKLLNGISKNE